MFLDGGGIRGLSTMIVLQELMHKIQDRHKLPSLPKPCEVFNLASGIGTGGLIVIMLFRLEMAIDQAIDAYIKLTEHAFSERKWLWWQEGTFKASRLEEAVLELIMDALGLDKIKAKEVRIFVCPVSSRDVSPPTRFRTWNSSGDAGCDCTIVEAARATCAAETVFKGINIGAESIHPRGLGCNNPTEYILQEAISVFPSEGISCVVSLGTGTVSQIGLDVLSHSPNTSSRNLVDTLRRMVADCEDRSQNITQQFSNIQDLYFRVNVDQGLQDMLMDEWRRVDDVRKYTEQYLGRQDIVDQVERLISRLLVEPTKQSSTTYSFLKPGKAFR
ncbi:FabD/lysophospholipase-like protein [Collybia nuda]|uniref:FabD/lysophospholipase-like protein n=1 Tax=Collybia nuda TaxID=64659 RepID=A0A9P5YFX0_9AGAR|nr:FabD/lysophospholipase-like protein [Collybia nuda]